MPTQAERIIALEETVTRLEAAIGQFTTQMSRDDLTAYTSKPENMLPNGEWPLFVRQRILNFNADEVWNAIGDIGGTFDALEQKIAALEARPAGTVVTPPVGTPFPTGVQVIEGDVVFKGRVGLGGIRAGNSSQLHLVSSGDATICLQNGDGDVSSFSLSGDGGLRMLNNQETMIEGTPAIDPDNDQPYTNYLKTVKPNQISSQIGIDSQHQFSINRTIPAGHPEFRSEHEYTQDVVLMIYEDQKLVAWELWRPGFKWALGIDAKYGPGRWWKAIFG